MATKRMGEKKKNSWRGRKKNDCRILRYIVIFIYEKDAKNLKRRRKEEKNIDQFTDQTNQKKDTKNDSFSEEEKNVWFRINPIYQHGN